MFSLQNCTLQSHGRGNDHAYWVSFEEKSFSKGEEFKVYNGRMNGNGPKAGDKCVVKVFRRCKGTERLCCCEMKKSQKAKELAREFNNRARDRKTRIKIATVYWAQMDEVSALKQLFFTGGRKLSTNEAVLFEEDVRVNEDKPNKPRHAAVFMDCHGRQHRCIAKDLEAFAHFTYHHSQGKLVICGFDGVQDEEGFYLKTPTIHSTTKEFGAKDRGEQGIREVFSNHVCNDFCSGWMKPAVGGASDVQVGVGDNVSVGKCWTAPSPACRPVYYGQDSRISQMTDSTMSSCVGQPALQWQESTVSHSSSSMGERPMTWRQESNMSQISERMSDYLEPTAPIMEEYNETMFQPTPPPYSEVFVANWLLGEQAANCFIPIPQEDPFMNRRDILVNQMSVESGPCCSLPAEDKKQNLSDQDFDVNANFTDDVDISGISTTGCVDDCDSSERAASVHFDQKQVRFSFSQGASSSVAPSNSSESHVDTSTAASGASSPSELRSILRQQSAASSSGYYSSHDRPKPIPKPRGVINFYHQPEQVQAGQNVTTPQSLPENPPSYFDSEMATAYWIVQRNCIPPNIFPRNTGNTDNTTSRVTPNASYPSVPISIPPTRNNYQNMNRSA